jgi:hypothetical protein
MIARRFHRRRPRPGRPRTGCRYGPLVLAVCAGLLAGCGGGGSGQSGNAFVFLTVDRFGTTGTSAAGAVNASIDNPNSTTTACATLRNNAKNPTVEIAAPTALDNVVIQSYTVRLSRFDGVPVQGSPFTINTAVLVPAGTMGNTATFPVIVAPAQIKLDPALRNARLPLSATAEIEFRGRDGRGQGVETEGALTVVFVRDADDTVATC